jgi:hypothetical protein
MTASKTIVGAALVLSAAALHGCGSQPSGTSQRAPQAVASAQPEASTARPIQPPGLAAQLWDTSIRLSLHQQFGKAAFKDCRLDIVTFGGDGSAYLRCVRNAAPPREMSRRHKLTAEDVNLLFGLVRDGNLFAGEHIGIDGTASDGPPFETLRVSVAADTVILVTSGNRSFTTGARRELLDWLQALMREFQDAPS